MKLSDVPGSGDTYDDIESSPLSELKGHASLLALKEEADQKAPKTRRRRISSRVLIVVSVISMVGTLGLLTGAAATGYASAVADIYPMAKMGAKEVSLNCNYAGEDYTVSSTYYSSIDRYYRLSIRKYGLMENGDFAKYVYNNASDPSIQSLADKIEHIGDEQDFSADQVLELTACFIQNIPYDQARADSVLSQGNQSYTEQYPYETLYKNSGICTDKAYLGSALLKELGYGTGIFVFPDAKHVALAVESPDGYGEFDSPYIMMELTTPGFAPGEIPEEIDAASGKPAARITKLSDLAPSESPESLNVATGSSISNPNSIITVNDGQPYLRIVAAKGLEKKILTALDALDTKVSLLDSAYGELERRERKQESAYNAYKRASWEQEESAYNSYSYAFDSYDAQIDYYNRLVDDYNNAIDGVKQDIEAYKNYDYN